MIKFIEGNELNLEIEKLIKDADETLVLISPYIKLHNRLASALLTKKDNPNLLLTILFGKNEENLEKSMNKEDLEFFMQFPNVEILYNKHLHAKFYANDFRAILTSMNLYDYSQNNNIEAGILFESSFKDLLTGNDSVEYEAWDFFNTILDQSEVIFKKEPLFKKKGLLRSKTYKGSNIIINKVDDFFTNKNFKSITKEKISKKENTEEQHIGYCIRTGKKIPYNRAKPLSDEAYASWAKYKDGDYPEKYCHFSGEPSYGKTSYNRPILPKNWRKAMEYERKLKMNK